MRPLDARRSRAFGLLTGSACSLAVMPLMFFRTKTLLWAEGQFGVELSGGLFFLILTGVVAAAGIGGCHLGDLPVTPGQKLVSNPCA